MINSRRKEVSSRARDQRVMRRLFGYLRPCRRLFCGALACAVLVGLLRVVQPKFMQYAIDRYIAHGDVHGLKWLAIFLLAIRLVVLLLSYVQAVLHALIGKRVIVSLRSQLFEKLQRLEIAFFDRTPVGSIMTQMTSDMDVLNEACTSVATGWLADLLTVLAIVGLMLWMDWQLTLLVLLSVPLLLLMMGHFRRSSQSSWEVVRSRLASFHSFVQEQLTGALTIQKFNREAKSLDKFHEVSEAHHKACVKVNNDQARFLSYVDMVYAFSLTIVIGYGGWRAMHGAGGGAVFTLGTLIAFIQYSQMLFQPIRDIYEKLNTLQSAHASARRIFRTLDRTVAVSPPVHPRKAGRFQGHIEFQNVWFAYEDEEWVLKDISFTIEPGQTVALVGRTGSGKSTIANLIMRFYDVQRGRVLLDGVDVREWDLKSLRENFSVVPQDVFLFSGTIEDNISLRRQQVTRERAIWAARKVCADEFIAKLPKGYETEVHERGDILSVGQKQLISFARTLAFNPSLLILDEATSSIDVETESLIRKTIESVLRGRTSLLIAHRLSTIQRSDRIIVLHQGEIREQGSHQQLLAAGGIYWRLYRLQFPVATREVGGELLTMCESAPLSL